jgi:DNA-binding LacI/PurR family transcriptional regulator
MHLSPESWREIIRFRDEGGIVVCYGCPAPSVDVDLVHFDEEDSAYQAVHHLLKMGHRRIGFSMHGGEIDLDSTRVQGVRRALAESGLKLRPDWVLRSGMYEEGGARLAENYLALRRRPTALCIVNDVTAAFFVQQLMRRGLRVPDAVSVVGQDDTPAAAHCIVPLSTVSQPVDEVAEGVCALLKQRLDGSDEPPQKIVVHGRLIQRESVAAPVSETSES